METTSLSLLKRLADSGDDADWQKLLTIYKPFICKVVQGYPALESHADDIAQEVILVLMRELPVFQRQRVGSFRAWLRNITVNQLRTALRKTKRQSAASDVYLDSQSQIESLADPHSAQSQQWDEEHDRAVFERIIAIVKPTLSAQVWQAFEQYAIANRPAEEVAKELGLSVNSVLLAKSRVLKRLREEAKGLVDD